LDAKEEVEDVGDEENFPRFNSEWAFVKIYRKACLIESCRCIQVCPEKGVEDDMPSPPQPPLKIMLELPLMETQWLVLYRQPPLLQKIRSVRCFTSCTYRDSNPLLSATRSHVCNHDIDDV